MILTKPNNIKIYGHRGARGDLPENTLESFKYLFENKITAYETDILLTKDLIPVVYHDFRLNPELTKIFYEAISLFDNLANSEKLQWRHILKPGELLIFNNWRVLHGRGSFNGKRKMKGCYINKEDFDSACKINGLI